MVALIATLALAGGGALTACGDPVNSRTGTPKGSETTSYAEPASEGHSNQTPGNSGNPHGPVN